MAILPGSLDYLYYNGIIDHIPYEAYEQLPMTPSGMAQMSGAGMSIGAAYPAMNGTQYLQAAQSGVMYDTYTCPDTFVRRSNAQEPVSSEYSISQKAFADGSYSQDSEYTITNHKENGRSMKESFKETYTKVSDTYSSTPTWVKGLIATGITALTLVALIKRIRLHK